MPGLISASYGDYEAKYIASTINSVVADMDVEEQLYKFGLHFDYIDQIRYNDIMKEKNR